ncbi:MAG: hydroxyacid dehydrogenase [Arenicellales bacterium]|jgi:(S)-sulfolactate dehydrogenase|nr:hydroxyacid dehydrogenase [Arenicellales bacterium]MDP7521507.1 hydroxyacid dehydrogenase [Arenicellales bacterium]|tara:strand:- start:2566 stop:3486 length:921 start_codon:yes stop_codon:yes gene_type:complete
MILITEFMDAAAVAALQSRFEVDYAPELADRQEDIPARLVGKRALIVRNRTQVTAALLASEPGLSCIGRLGVGLDNIDLDACQQADCQVYPAIGANALAVAEYAVTMALLLLRGAYASTPAVIAGHWPRQACMGSELGGKTLGLVGYGSIARETARLGTALGMECMAYDPLLPAADPAWGNTRQTSLDELFQQAHVVSLHVPLTDNTRNMVDRARLAQMQPDAVLINTARGGIVDETALVEALAGGRLGGAVLDVFATEPLDSGAGKRFENVPNLILTPHIAGVTVESNQRISALIAKKISQHLDR